MIVGQNKLVRLSSESFFKDSLKLDSGAGAYLSGPSLIVFHSFGTLASIRLAFKNSPRINTLAYFDTLSMTKKRY